MAEIKVGDLIRIKDRSDWPSPPGYRLADSEGKVTSVSEEEGFVTIHLEKTDSGIAKGTTLVLRLEKIEKVEL
jgi:hypothetical protein